MSVVAGERGGSPVAAGLALVVVAVAFAVGVVLVGRPLGAALTARLPGGWASDPAAAEALFTVVIFAPILVAGWLGGGLAGGRRGGGGVALRLAAGAALGAGGIAAALGYAAIAGTLVRGAARAAGYGAGPGLLAAGAAVALLQVAAEEAYFRGWLQPALARRWGTAASLAVTALVFAGLHLVGGARDAIALLNLFLGGLMFGLLALMGRGIAAAVGAHLAWNIVEEFGVGLDPNPGLGSFGALIDWDLVGPAAWGGSAEGLNASWPMTFALAAIVLPLALLCWRPGAAPVSDRASRRLPQRA